MLKEEKKSSHPAPGLQTIHLETWHRKDPRWKVQVTFHHSYRCFNVKQTQSTFLPIWLLIDSSEGSKHETDSSDIKESENTHLISARFATHVPFTQDVKIIQFSRAPRWPASPPEWFTGVIGHRCCTHQAAHRGDFQGQAREVEA